MDIVALEYINTLIDQTEARTIEVLKVKQGRKIKLDKNHFKLDNKLK